MKYYRSLVESTIVILALIIFTEELRLPLVSAGILLAMGSVHAYNALIDDIPRIVSDFSIGHLLLVVEVLAGILLFFVTEHLLL
jgi:hypothetical protein